MWQRDKDGERRQLEMQRLEELKQLREKNMLNVPLNFDVEEKLNVESTPTVFDTTFIQPIRDMRRRKKKEPTKTVIVYKDNTFLMGIMIGLLIIAIAILGAVLVVLYLQGSAL